MRVHFDLGPKQGHAADHASTLEAIPAELRNLDQWVCWRYEDRDGTPTKPPIQAKSNGRLLYAKSNDPNTWSDFTTAVNAVARLNLEGQGLCLSESDRLTALDLDHVFDPATGELDPLAIQVLEHFAGTYVEISPSGTGFRIFCYGKPSRSGKCAGKAKWLEVYSYPSKRYLTVTGNHWPSSATTVTDQQVALDWLHGQFMEPPRTSANSNNKSADTLDLDDATLLDKARNAKNGALFSALLAGDTSHYSDPVRVVEKGKIPPLLTQLPPFAKGGSGGISLPDATTTRLGNLLGLSLRPADRHEFADFAARCADNHSINRV